MESIGMYQYRIGKSIPKYELGGGLYCSHWGLTDLYEECEKNLRELLDSGEDFITDWCGSKKEIISARYSRYDGNVHVEVCQSIDDLYESDDLIYDALWSSLHREDIEFPDEIIDSIRDAAIDYGIDDSTTESVTLPADATYDDVMKAVVWLEDQTDKRLNAWYEALQTIVRAHVEYMEAEE